jgi:hypothetical protein
MSAPRELVMKSELLLINMACSELPDQNINMLPAIRELALFYLRRRYLLSSGPGY